GEDDLEGGGGAEVAENLAEGPVLDLVQLVDAFDAAIGQPNRVVEQLRMKVRRAVVQVPVDRGAEHCTAVIAVELWPVGSAAEETHPKGCLADDHGLEAEEGAVGARTGAIVRSSRRSSRNPR